MGFGFPHEAKDFIEDWIDNQDIDLSDRVPQGEVSFEHEERPFELTETKIVEAMPQEALDEVYSECDTSLEVLAKLVWCTQDGIEASVLKSMA